jgi:predicted  nucleic acid-binding Zn-ribbon protein
MACTEHVCRRCDYTIFNNHPNVERCPKCGCGEFQTFYDEDRDDDRPSARDEEE